MKKGKLQFSIQVFMLRFWPIFWIFLLWFIFASPYFVNGNVPFPSTYQVNHFVPWSSYPKFWGPVKNGAMPDLIDQIYPWKHFTIEALKSGQIPLWNPNNFSGNPHLANFQSAVLSPFNLLYFIFPFIDAWSLIVLLQPLIAGLLTYLLMREFQVSKAGAVFSAVAFMFCGFMVVWMAYGTLSMGIAFLPLALFAIERSFKKLRFKTLFLLSISIAFSLFSGHFQTSLYFLIFSFSFFIYKVVSSRKKQTSFFVFLFFLFGLFLAMPQLLPSIEFYQNAVRSNIFSTGGAIPFSYLVTLFSPDFFGNPVTRNNWFGYYAEWASFVGIIPVVLAFFSLYKIKKLLIRFFFVGAIISLFFAIESPLQQIVSSLHIPVLSTSIPSRIIVLFSFSLSVLAGFGLDTLFEIANKKSLIKIFFPFAAIGLVLLVTAFILFVQKPLSVDETVIAKRNMILPIVFFAVSMGMILLSTVKKKLLFASIAVLLFISSIDSLRFAQKWMPFDPRNYVFADLKVIDGLHKNIGYARVYGNLGAQVETYYNIPSLQGYDPLYIARYGEFIQAAAGGEYMQPERSVVKLVKNGLYTDRIIDFSGASVIFHPVGDTNQGWAYPVWKNPERFSAVYDDKKFQLFKNNSAMDRAVLFTNYEVIPDSRTLLKTFFQKSFDMQKTLLLEQDPDLKIVSSATGSAQISTYQGNKVQIKVNSPTNALLLLTDNYYPGWKASIDGVSTRVLRADYSFRAIPVGKGEHTITFIYDPGSFKQGIFLAALSIVSMGLSFVFLKRKSF